MRYYQVGDTFGRWDFFPSVNWKRSAVFLCLLLGLSAGCAGNMLTQPPSEAELRWAESERQSIGRFMNRLENRIRAGDIEAVMREFVYAGTSASRLQENYKNFKRAAWAPELRGYQFRNIEKSLRELHWADLKEGRVFFKVEATCARGRKREDTFSLFRPGAEWLITAATLGPPEQNAALELDRADSEEINKLLEPVLKAIGRGDVEDVMELFPHTYEALYREEPAGRRLRREPRIHSTKDDLLALSKLEIKNIPEPEAGFPARYAGNMSVFLSYGLHAKEAGGNDENSEFSLFVYVRENEEREWERRKLRLVKEPK